MNLFRKKEKKECCCHIDEESMKKAEELKNEKGIKILGSGCQKCEKLEESVKKAIEELNLNLEIEHITDFSKIASYGVMSTPAFVLNGEVVSFGKVLSVDEVKHILSIKWKDQ
ncbi:MAG: thioredoxin family protein [Massilimicrobiota timonensis]